MYSLGASEPAAVLPRAEEVVSLWDVARGAPQLAAWGLHVNTDPDQAVLTTSGTELGLLLRWMVAQGRAVVYPGPHGDPVALFQSAPVPVVVMDQALAVLRVRTALVSLRQAVVGMQASVRACGCDRACDGVTECVTV